MKKREIKKNIENNTLKLVVTEETKDNIYDSLPNIIKVCNMIHVLNIEEKVVIIKMDAANVKVEESVSI